MKCVERLELSIWGFRLRLMLMLMLKLMLIFNFSWPVVHLAIFCNNPLSVSIVFERRAKYSGAIFKDSLHFQWWAGNFNFTCERVQHTMKIMLGLMFCFCMTLHTRRFYATLSNPKSKQSKPSLDQQGQKVETCCAKCCQNVVHCQKRGLGK